MYVWVREKESVCMCVWGREIYSLWVCFCICVRQRRSVGVFMCVFVCDFVCERAIYFGCVLTGEWEEVWQVMSIENQSKVDDESFNNNNNSNNVMTRDADSSSTWCTSAWCRTAAGSENNMYDKVITWLDDLYNNNNTNNSENNNNHYNTDQNVQNVNMYKYLFTMYN